MKLYKRFECLSYWCRYQSTYLEMKYHLKKLLKGKIQSYIKPIHSYDRNIGKSAALARLSAKYNIPVAVPSHRQAITIEKNIPNSIPKYFKKNKPKTIVVCDKWMQKRYEKYKILLVEEDMSDYQFAAVISNNNVLGYKRIYGERN